MAGASSSNVGMKQARVLASLSRERQFELIAEGLPLLLGSASDLLRASADLDRHPRAVEILRGHASEECSKILILMDIVRCPPGRAAARIGPMIGWFYNHLARLIYVEAQAWKPTDVAMLQQYVDSSRRSHTLEGYEGEYIMPNWTLFARESLLYADIMIDEEGEPGWNIPEAAPTIFDEREPPVFQLCEALAAFGFFSRQGLDVVAGVWGQTEFVGDRDCWSKRAITHETILRLSAQGLITELADEHQQRLLHELWQVPMYNIDFSPIKVPLYQLQAERDATSWNYF